MTIYIKNMVCNRCKMVVKSTLENLGLHPIRLDLGEVTLRESNISSIKDRLDQELRAVGFELLDNKRARTIEKIKNLIIDLVQHKDNSLDYTLSEYLKQALHQDYSALSNLFSEVEGITIEKFYILQKVERVKELIAYGEMTLSEIAFQLNYSSVSYLSNQFKKVTGMTPSKFKKLRTIKRKPLDDL